MDSGSYFTERNSIHQCTFHVLDTCFEHYKSNGVKLLITMAGMNGALPGRVCNMNGLDQSMVGTRPVKQGGRTAQSAGYDHFSSP